MDGYTRLWEGHIRTSGEGRKQHMQVAVDLGGFKKTDDSLKYQGLTTEATILGWVSGSEAVHRGSLRNEQEAALLLDQTTFYAEKGGQVADVGTIQTSTCLTGPCEKFSAITSSKRARWWTAKSCDSISPTTSRSLWAR
jgi:alanyl-tRNA synthetase